MTSRILSLSAFFIICTSAAAQNYVLDVSKPTADVQPTMWGIFFEDINFGADGGLYAELIKNRSFEFDTPLMGWTQPATDRFSLNDASGSALVINRGDEEKLNPRFVRVTTNSDKGYSLTNEGFRGMGIKKGIGYTLTFLASQHDGSHTRIRARIVSSSGILLGETIISPEESGWKKYSGVITASGTDAKAKLTLLFEGKGIVDLDMISMFPSDTWKNRPNGLRKDLVQLLADMKPGFLRFPGGCIVEGRELATRYQWKKTVGSVDDREMIVNRWNTEFAHRLTPDYYQTFGLGFYEYFLTAEDIGAEPLPILSCGMACQFNTAEVVPMEEIDPYIQDALDLIEFANADASTAWGKVRAAMGHATPFNLKMIGVGNEQWGPQYIERYKAFVKGIKDKYPSIKIVTSNGPFPDGELFDYADKQLRGLNAEIIDEHYYNKPEWFLKNATRYDSYDRKGPKIFAGEYAAQSVAIASPENKNNWDCALAEAAFMTGLERNAAVVNMCSYAPLFAHAEGWQWTPDLIWFDNLNSYATPNYYVQQLFSLNKGSKVLPMLSGSEAITGQQGIYASAVLDNKTGEVIMKIINTTSSAVVKEVELKGVSKVNSKGIMVVLKSDDLAAENSLSHPNVVVPLETAVTAKGKRVSLSLAPYSFSVVKLKL